MKKICLFLAAAMLVAGLSVKEKIEFDGFDSVTLYVKGCFESEGTVNGDHTIIKVPPQEAAQKLTEYDVTAVALKSKLTIAELRQKYNIRILKTEEAAGRTSYLGYAAGLWKNSIELGGMKINVRLTLSEDGGTMMGLPDLFSW